MRILILFLLFRVRIVNQLFWHWKEKKKKEGKKGGGVDQLDKT